MLSHVRCWSNYNEHTPTMILIGSSKQFCGLMSHKALQKKKLKQGMTKPSITFEVFRGFNYNIQTPPPAHLPKANKISITHQNLHKKMS